MAVTINDLNGLKALIQQKAEEVVKQNTAAAAEQVKSLEMERMYRSVATWYGDYSPRHYQRTYSFYQLPQGEYRGNGLDVNFNFRFTGVTDRVEVANEGLHGARDRIPGITRYKIWDEYAKFAENRIYNEFKGVLLTNLKGISITL